MNVEVADASARKLVDFRGPLGWQKSAVGLGTVAGVSRAFDLTLIKGRSGVHLLILGALLATVCADLSMLSKAEVERIWLPYTIWLTAAGALLPPRSRRWWLGLNVIGALALNHLILTNW